MSYFVNIHQRPAYFRIEMKEEWMNLEQKGEGLGREEGGQLGLGCKKIKGILFKTNPILNEF